jgi:hypothetical protein
MSLLEDWVLIVENNLLEMSVIQINTSLGNNFSKLSVSASTKHQNPNYKQFYKVYINVVKNT